MSGWDCALCDAPTHLHNNQLPDHHDPGCKRGTPLRSDVETRVARLESMAHPPMDVTATVTQIADAVARLIEADSHQFSTRPCQTCRAVSSLLARPFGCSARSR